MNSLFININNKNRNYNSIPQCEFINLYVYKDEDKNNHNHNGFHSNIIYKEIKYFQNKNFLDSDFEISNDMLIIDLSDKNTFNKILNFVKIKSYDTFLFIEKNIIYHNNILYISNKDYILKVLSKLVYFLNNYGIDGYFIHSGITQNSNELIDSHIQYTNVKNKKSHDELYSYIYYNSSSS